MIKKDAPFEATVSNFKFSWFKMPIAILTGIIVTRSLGPELKGAYANFRLIITLYLPFLLVGYSGGVLYYGLRSKIDIPKMFWSSFLLVLTVSLLLMPGVYWTISKGWLGAIAGESETFTIAIITASTPCILLNIYCESVVRSYHQFRAKNLRNFIGLLVTLLYVLTALLITGINLNQALFGVIAGQVTQLILNLWFILKKIGVRWHLSFKQIFKPWNYGWRTVFTRIIGKSNDKFDLIALSFLIPAASFGVYTVGVGLSNQLKSLPASYVNVFYNQIAEKNDTEALNHYAKAQRITFLITIPMAIALTLLAYPLIYLMYGKAFTPAAWVVLAYSPGLVFQVAAQLSVKFYAGMGKPLKNSLIYLSGFLISAPCYFVLIPKFGIFGAAISSSIAYFTAFCFSVLQLKREYKIDISSLFWIQKNDLRFVFLQLKKLPLFGNLKSA